MKQVSRKVLIRSLAVMALAVTVAGSAIQQSVAAVAVEHIVMIKSLKFKPSVLSVQPGDTIKWINQDVVPHTATASDKSWDTGRLNKGESKSLTVTTDMNANYFCRFHPNMKAMLEIKLAD